MWHGINIWSTIGLITDIVGVILLFQYGLPSKLKSNGGVRLMEESTEDEKIRVDGNKKIVRGANAGLGLIITGFILQLIGNNVSFFN